MVTFNERELQSAFRLYAADSKRDLPTMTNAAAFDIARWAIEETEKAHVGKISNVEKESWWPKYIAQRIGHGVSVTFGRGDKRKRVQFKGSYTQSEAKRVSTKIITARKRARSFIAAGWLGAVQDLAARVFGEKDGAARTRAPGVKQVGQRKGYGRAARPSWNPVAEIVNLALNAMKFSKRPNPMPIAQRGLQKAYRRKAADFMEVVAKRMQRTAAKYSAK